MSQSLVAMLYSEAYQQFKDCIQSMQKFSPAWLTGTTNCKISNVRTRPCEE